MCAHLPPPASMHRRRPAKESLASTLSVKPRLVCSSRMRLPLGRSRGRQRLCVTSVLKCWPQIFPSRCALTFLTFSDASIDGSLRQGECGWLDQRSCGPSRIARADVARVLEGANPSSSARTLTSAGWVRQPAWCGHVQASVGVWAVVELPCAPGGCPIGQPRGRCCEQGRNLR